MGTKPLSSDGLMECSLSTYQARGIEDPTHTKYEYDSIDELGDGHLGGSSDTNIEGQLR